MSGLVELSANQAAPRNLCWNCREDVGQAIQCDHCVKLQPLGRNSDYFAIMGLPRRLTIDPQLLESLFHALSRRFHPDAYRLASPRERLIALENSAVLNQAYRTLREPFSRSHYLLQLERGRADDLKPVAPADLFEEILEVQECMSEYRVAEPEAREPLRAQLETHRRELAERKSRLEQDLTARWIPEWDAGARGKSEGRTAALTGIERVLSERAYLNRVLDGLNRLLGTGSGSEPAS